MGLWKQLAASVQHRHPAEHVEALELRRSQALRRHILQLDALGVGQHAHPRRIGRVGQIDQLHCVSSLVARSGALRSGLGCLTRFIHWVHLAADQQPPNQHHQSEQSERDEGRSLSPSVKEDAADLAGHQNSHRPTEN